MIKILYPKPGDVSRMGGKQLMEIQADTEAEIMALHARVDDGVQTFVAAPGSVAHTPDHSADWEFSPAGTWVKRGGGTPYERVILPETVLEGFEDDTQDGIPESYALPDPWTHEPYAGAVWIINYNGKDYECEAMDFNSLNPALPAGAIFVFGNTSAIGSDDIPVINTDIPFGLVAMANEFGEGEGQYGTVCPLPINSMPSVTLSVREKVKVASAGGSGSFTVSATITTMSDDNLTGYAIFDKTFAETLAAVKAGRYVTCRVDVGDSVMHIVPACGYGSDFVEFILTVNGMQLRVQYFEDSEEGPVEITPPAS